MQLVNNDKIIEELLGEYQVQRSELMNMVTDIEDIKKNINDLFPEKLNARYTRFFEEKIKTATSLLNVLLDVRKEIIKSMKDEIELRRRVDPESKSELADILDVRKIAGKIERLKKKTDNVTDKFSSKEKQDERREDIAARSGGTSTS